MKVGLPIIVSSMFMFLFVACGNTLDRYLEGTWEEVTSEDNPRWRRLDTIRFVQTDSGLMYGLPAFAGINYVEYKRIPKKIIQPDLSYPEDAHYFMYDLRRGNKEVNAIEQIDDSKMLLYRMGGWQVDTIVFERLDTTIWGLE